MKPNVAFLWYCYAFVMLHEKEAPKVIYLKPMILSLPTVVINPKKFKRPKV